MNIIIPAAGHATRMRPLSNSMSKAMIPVNGRPVISYILEKIKTIPNLENIVIVQNASKDIERFVKIKYKNLYESGVIKFASQTVQSGPLDAIYCGFKQLENKNSDLLIWLGDTIYEYDKDEFLKFTSQSSIITSKINIDIARWCRLESNNETSVALHDKTNSRPDIKDAIIGIYYIKEADLAHTFAGLAAWRAASQTFTESEEWQISVLLNKIGIRNFKAISTNNWYDCGELQSYYETKARLLSRSSRNFNILSLDNESGVLCKYSNDSAYNQKIKLEGDWYNSLSFKQSIYVPKSNMTNQGLLMSLESGTPLNELYVYDNIRPDSWEYIIKKLVHVVLNVFGNEETIITSDVSAKIICEKSVERIKKYNYSFISDNDKSVVLDFLNNLEEEIKNETVNYGRKIVHGDSHFGNILFDAFTGNLKWVDPRGYFIEGVTGGDVRYDLAKIGQDIYLNYSHILAENYEIINDEVVISKSVNLSKIYDNILMDNGFNPTQIKKISISLLLSCLPFHEEDERRQRTMWTVGVKLIKSLILENERA